MNCLVIDLFLAPWDGIRCLIKLLFSNVQHESAGIQVHTVLRLGYLKRSTGKTESDGVMQKKKKSKLGQFIALKSYGYALYHVQAIACLTICTVSMQLSDYQTHGQVSATDTENASLSLTTVRKLHQQCTSMALSNLTSPQQIRTQQ